MLAMRNIHIQFEKEIIIGGDFKAYSGQLTGLVGKSGAGKSSLFNILSLAQYHQEDYNLDSQSLKDLSPEKRKELMRTRIAYMTQTPLFYSSLTCEKQLFLEAKLAGKSLSKKEALSILDSVGLTERRKAYPISLSGGEKQRLAIAMALAKEADILICDEVTSALDENNTVFIMRLLKKLAKEKKKTVLLASHDKNVIAWCDAVYQIQDKRIIKMKETSVQIKDEPFMFPKRKKVSLKTYFYLTVSKMRRNLITWLLLVAISSLLVGSLAFSLTLSHQLKLWESAKKKETCQNELLVTQHLKNEVNLSGRYNDENLPLDQSVIEKIQYLNGKNTVYPFYTAATLNPDMQQNDRYTMDFYEKGNLVQQVEFTFYDDHQMRQGIVPYYPEEKMEEHCLSVFENKNGIYLDEWAMEMLGVAEIHEGTTIQMTIYLPTAYTKVNRQDIYNPGIGPEVRVTQDETAMLIYEPVKMNLPVSGILNVTREDVSGMRTGALHIPYHILSDYQQEALARHPFKDDEYPFQPSSVMVFVKDMAQYTDTVSQIKKLAENIGIKQSRFYSVSSFDKYDKRVELFYDFGIYGLFAIVLGMMIIYSGYHNKDNQNDDRFLQIRGLRRKERLQLGLLEVFIIWLFIGLFSLAATHYFFENGIGVNFLTPVHTLVAPISQLRLSLIVGSLSFLMAFASRFLLFLQQVRTERR